jgi:uncharacterized membrane protein
MNGPGLWHTIGAWPDRRRARRREQRRQSHQRQLLLWGGPVEAGRVLAFSDAIFAIAITLLTINLLVPPGLHGAAFTTALHRLLPAIGAYALSFLILGQLWLAHHRIFGVIARVDYVVLRRNLVFLGLIAIMPAGMFAPRYAALVWALMIPLRLVVARFAHLAGQGAGG